MTPRLSRLVDDQRFDLLATQIEGAKRFGGGGFYVEIGRRFGQLTQAVNQSLIDQVSIELRVHGKILEEDDLEFIGGLVIDGFGGKGGLGFAGVEQAQSVCAGVGDLG